MLREPRCSIRRCKHYTGTMSLDGTEATERQVCKAFPKGIPPEIAYGENDHLKPLKGQQNDLVYEQEG